MWGGRVGSGRGLRSDLGGDWGRIWEGIRAGFGRGVGPDLGVGWGRIWEGGSEFIAK